MSETTYDPHRSCQHKVYKMTCAEFDALYDHRDGRCHICLTPASEGRRLVIDHAREYDLRAVRGLLCDKCNALMRRVDNRERYDQRAADYMHKAWFLRALVGAAALLLTLTACGGGDKVSDGDGPPSLSSLADTVGCTNVKQDAELMGVTEGGSCDLDGAEVFLYTYPSAKQMSDLHEVTRLGGGVWVVGDRWEAQAPTRSAAEKVAEATGGEVE